MDSHEMPTEIAIEDRHDGRMRNYVEVGVEAGDDLTDVYAEDADGDSVTLHLSVAELDQLIASLQRARAVAVANS